MKKAIKVLEKQLEVCANMIKWYEDELSKNNHIMADGLVIFDYRSKKSELEEIKKECLQAIDYLKNK